MREIYFKKTISGMVLMVKNKYPAHFPGDWKYKWEKATEEQSQTVLCSIAKFNDYKRILDELKEFNPEILI